jgi:hypothetical protein
MIINQNEEVVVPEKTIAFFPVIQYEEFKKFDIKDIGLFLKPLNTSHKRDWFASNFYRCLPLSIGNMQGFVFSLPYSIDILWNGGNNPEDLKINYYEDFEKYRGYNFIYVTSEFGHGIFTIHFPITLKTPPGINLMTIAPPNFPTPGLSPMTGVVESDNLRFSFTLNIKVDLPNTVIQIGPDTPLVGMIPIPRYFCDSFELKDAYEIFDKNIVDDEVNTTYNHGKLRDETNEKNITGDGSYYSGKDIFGNKFKDHQLPKKNNG